MSKCVIIGGVRPRFARALSASLADARVNSLVIDSDSFSQLEFSLSEPPSRDDYIEFAGETLHIDEILGSYSEGLIEGYPHLNGLEREFQVTEVSAAFSYLRIVCPRAINPPVQGSSGPFFRSLIEQWEIVRSIEFLEVPELQLYASTVVDCTLLAIQNIYDYRIPVAMDSSSHETFVLPVQKPIGIRMITIFSGDDLFHICERQGAWMELKAGKELTHKLINLLKCLRSAFDIEVGQISYFYCGRITFWSASPYAEPWLLGQQSKIMFFKSLVKMLTGKEEANKTVDSTRYRA